MADSSTLAARLAHLEREMHAEQLLAIAASVDGEFSAAELLERASFDADLRTVLRDAQTPRQVGRRLLQLAAHPSPSVRLVRIARNGDGCIWVVEIHSDAGFSLDGSV